MNWTIIDLETTGLSPKKDSIIEIGALRRLETGESKEYQCLIDPGFSLPPYIKDITGIDDALLCGQPRIEDVIGSFADFIDDTVLIAHNAPFDGAFLRQYIDVEPDQWLDTIVLAKIAFPDLPSYGLVNLIASLDLKNAAPHRAMGDALATALLFERIEAVFSQMDKTLIAALVRLFDDQAPVYAAYFQRFAESGVHYEFLPPSHFVPKEREEKREVPADYQINEEEICRLLTAENGLKRFLPELTPREAQVEMAMQTAAAFNDGHFLLAEAGTGTGKTIAYLLPAAFLSYVGGKRVIISTHTLHLQDQIIDKDLPAINPLFQGQLKSLLLKGRNHYLCYRKWKDAWENQSFENAVFLVSRLLPWAAKTKDGDVDVLNLSQYERRDWNHFSADSETCLSFHCPFYRGQCFITRLRKKAEEAHILIVNHSLLLTDAVMRRGILPEAAYLVVDEAHQLERVAEDHLGYLLTYFDHVKILGECRRFLNKQVKEMALPALFQKADHYERQLAIVAVANDLLREIDEKSRKGDELFQGLQTYATFYLKQANGYTRTLRIDKKARQRKDWEGLRVLAENFSLWVNDLEAGMKNIKRLLDEIHVEEESEQEDLALFVILSKLGEITACISLFLFAEEENMVSWLEMGTDQSYYPQIRLAPLAVNRILADKLFKEKESIVFVSATLSVNHDFSFYMENCGLDLIERECRTLLLSSPFDYKKNLALIAATDLPLAGFDSEILYVEAISRAISELVRASRGRALVLFTSHFQLKEVYHRIRDELTADGIQVLAHEISGNRSTLLKAIREEPRTLILGANSFWEGVDIAGENLSLLIIAKLPFWPPDMPVMAAKMEKMEEEKKNAFYHYSLPQAVLRFKQGFGRLLRQESDHGVVCVLDRRIYEKRYGRFFVDSLPVDKLYRMEVSKIAAFIAKKI